MAERPLIGLSPDQVSTNGMLGDLAFENSDGAYIEKLRGKTTLEELQSNININIKDVFVYDTSKDTDGGAWRYNTKHTTWYNETLNTEYRGSRREFPSIAIITTEAGGTSGPTRVTIYDGDDPEMPMWMVFNGVNPRGILSWSTSNMSKLRVAALNGFIATASNDGGVIFGLTEDLVELMYSSKNYNIKTGRTIADRNNTVSYQIVSGTAQGVYKTPWYATNDVAMTVPPSTPIDPLTGVQRPTIAIATDKGLSFIKHDRTVSNITSMKSYEGVKNIYFDDDHYLWMTAQSSSSSVTGIYNYLKYSIPGVIDYSNNVYDDNAEVSYFPARSWANYLPNWNGVYPVNDGNDENIRYIAPCHDGGVVANKNGLSIFKHNTSDHQNGMVAYIGDDFNSGYMHGDIKGAFLSSTDSTTLDGYDLISNPTFDTNLTGWNSTNSATVTRTTLDTEGLLKPYGVSSGIIKIVSAGSNSGASTSISVVSGKTYILEAMVYQVSYNSHYIYVGTSAGSNNVTQIYGPSFEEEGKKNTWQRASVTFTANSTGTYYVTLVPSQASGRIMYADEVHVRQADPDRSANGLYHDESSSNRSMTVYGTISKEPVATGAELMAYGPFTSANHFRHRPHQNLIIGTKDAYEIIWFKTSDASGYGMLMSYEGGDGSNTYSTPQGGIFNLRIEQGKLSGYATTNNFSTYHYIQHPNLIDDDKWHQAAWVKRNDMYELYLDGDFIGYGGSGSGTGDFDGPIGNQYTELVIGSRKRSHEPGTGDEPFNGKLALARFGHSAPTKEQIRLMYLHEKTLFQENAKATIYGTSSDVTALDYDNGTGLLHVGTSAGRSDFNGLRRINNTTTAVTTVISAQDGFIAQQ